MPRCHAEISTASASRYLQQLCKHFAHKLPVEFDPNVGRIGFAIGDCDLSADGEKLSIELSASAAEQMPQLKDVVVRHLERFAFREELTVAWADR